MAPPIGHRLRIAIAAFSLLLPPSADRAWGEVVVIANRLAAPLSMSVTTGGPSGELATILPGESRPFFGTGPFTASITPAGAVGVVTGPAVGLASATAYHVVQGPQGPEVRRLGLKGDRPGEQPMAIDPAAIGVNRGVADKRPLFVPVWVMVDEEQPSPEGQWRGRLRARVEGAGEVLLRHSLVGLRVVGYGVWQSDNRLLDFDQTLSEFEARVQPPEGVVAIGFTSQYPAPTATIRVGGTRGALRRHVLVRDWSPNVSEAERIEMLVHEFGHYLGAAHSPEPTSVMRPTFGDRLALRKSFRVGFDPVNTLAVAMVGDELRTRRVTSMAELSAETAARLAAIYATLAEALPEDTAAHSMRGALRLPSAQAAVGAIAPGASADAQGATRAIAAIADAALANSKRPLAPPNRARDDATPYRSTGDALATLLVRSAAQGIKPDRSPAALLVAIGIGLDDSEVLIDNPRFAGAVTAVEPAELRARRLAVLGEPTACGRRDTLKHFALSAAITALVGKDEALVWGLGKEAIDATGKSGYSFADIAADLAGVRFAEAVLAGRVPVESLDERFEIEHFVPPLEGLAEGLPIDRVTKDYGGLGDPRFDRVLEEIRRRIDALPPYAASRLRFDTRSLQAD
ncbi:MAG: matrixin family metalloprotease [Lacipirellulaceae bacterium]